MLQGRIVVPTSELEFPYALASDNDRRTKLIVGAGLAT